KFQKKSLGWWASDDFQEMRVGWSPMVTEIESPVVTQYPHMLEEFFPKTDVTGAAGKIVAHAGSILVGLNEDKAEHYLSLNLGDILEANKIAPFLSDGDQLLLQKLIDKAAVDIDYVEILKKQVADQSKGIFDKIKKKIGYPTEKKVVLVGP